MTKEHARDLISTLMLLAAKAKIVAAQERALCAFRFDATLKQSYTLPGFFATPKESDTNREDDYKTFVELATMCARGAHLPEKNVEAIKTYRMRTGARILLIIQDYRASLLYYSSMKTDKFSKQDFRALSLVRSFSNEAIVALKPFLKEYGISYH